MPGDQEGPGQGHVACGAECTQSRCDGRGGGHTWVTRSDIGMTAYHLAKDLLVKSDIQPGGPTAID